MRGSYRLRCLKRAFSRDVQTKEKNARWKLFKTAILCWTIYDKTDVGGQGITHVIIFPGGKNESITEYFDKESLKLYSFRNLLVAFGRISYA